MAGCAQPTSLHADAFAGPWGVAREMRMGMRTREMTRAVVVGVAAIFVVLVTTWRPSGSALSRQWPCPEAPLPSCPRASYILLSLHYTYCACIPRLVIDICSRLPERCAPCLHKHYRSPAIDWPATTTTISDNTLAGAAPPTNTLPLPSRFFPYLHILRIASLQIPTHATPALVQPWANRKLAFLFPCCSGECGASAPTPSRQMSPAFCLEYTLLR